MYLNDYIYINLKMAKKLKLHTEVVIDSCHYLDGYEGDCKRLHGHSWKIELWFKGEPRHKNKVGILVDFKIVSEIKKKLDHRLLNDIIKKNPTAENITEWVYKFIQMRINKEIDIKVRVYETAVGKLTYCEMGDFE